jgi:hypothetical protein
MESSDLALDLVVPQTSIKTPLGTIDPVAIALGVSLTAILSEVLGPVARAPAYTVQHPASRKNHDVFPIAFPPGAGVNIPLGRYSKFVRGDIGLHNVDGVLLLHVPDAFRGAIEQGLARQMAEGRARFNGITSSPNGYVATYVVTPLPGTEWTFDILGKVRIGVVFP